MRLILTLIGIYVQKSMIILTLKTQCLQKHKQIIVLCFLFKECEE